MERDSNEDQYASHEASPPSPADESPRPCGAGCGDECLPEAGNDFCRHGVIFHSSCLRNIVVCCPHLSPHSDTVTTNAAAGQDHQSPAPRRAPSTLDPLPAAVTAIPETTRTIITSLLATAAVHALASSARRNLAAAAAPAPAHASAPPSPPTLLASVSQQHAQIVPQTIELDPTHPPAVSPPLDIDIGVGYLSDLIERPTRRQRFPTAAWRCTICTYGNASRDVVCDMCGAQRSSARAPATSTASTVTSTAPSESPVCAAPHGDECITCFSSTELVEQHPCGCRVVCQPCADSSYTLDSRCVCTACSKRQVETAGTSTYVERHRSPGDYEAASQQLRAHEVACGVPGCGTAIDPYDHVASSLCATHSLWLCSPVTHPAGYVCPVCCADPALSALNGPSPPPNPSPTWANIVAGSSTAYGQANSDSKAHHKEKKTRENKRVVGTRAPSGSSSTTSTGAATSRRGSLGNGGARVNTGARGRGRPRLTNGARRAATRAVSNTTVTHQENRRSEYQLCSCALPSNSGARAPMITNRASTLATHLNTRSAHTFEEIIRKYSPEDLQKAGVIPCAECQRIFARSGFASHAATHTDGRATTRRRGRNTNHNSRRNGAEANEASPHPPGPPPHTNPPLQITHVADPSPASLADHPPLFRYVPRRSWRVLQQALRPLLKTYLDASTTQDKASAGSSFLFAFRYVLCRGKRGGKGKQAQSIQSQLRKNAAIIQGLANSHDPAAPPIPQLPATPPYSTEEEMVERDNEREALTRAILDLLNQGFVSKARRRVTADGVMDIDADVLDTLKRLHPTPTDTSPMPRPPKAYLYPDLSLAQVRRMVKSAANGSAPGPSGITGATLLSLVGDDTCARGIGAILKDILNGEVSQGFAALLACSSLLALKKKLPGDARPLALGEELTKIAAKYSLTLVKDDLTAIFGASIQFGIGARGGAAAAAQVIRINLEALEAKYKDSFLMLFDLANAYNTISRQKCLEALYAQESLRPLWPLVDLLYKDPSALVVKRVEGSLEILSSKEGVRQGCVFGPLLFCLGISTLFQEFTSPSTSTSTSTTDLGKILGTAVVDDLAVATTADNVLPALQKMERLAPKYGVTLNYSKMLIVGGGATKLSPEIAEALLCKGVKVQHNRQDVTKHLGTALLGSSDSASNWVNKRVKANILPAIDRVVKAPLPLRYRLILLKEFSRSSFTYYNLTLPLQALQTPGHTLSDHLTKAVHDCLGEFGVTPVAASLPTQLRLWQPFPTHSFSLTIPTAAAAALYASSVSTAIHRSAVGELYAKLPPQDRSAFFSALPTLCTSQTFLKLIAEDAIRRFPELRLNFPTTLPRTMKAMLEQFHHAPPRLGYSRFLRSFEQKAHQQQATADLSDMDPSYAAACRSRAPSHASLWSSSLGDLLHIPDHLTALAIANHLSYAPVSDMPDHCPCGAPLSSWSSRIAMDHILSCRRASGNTFIQSHNLVVDVLAEICVEAGASVQKEVALMDDRRDRPDITATFHDKAFYIDVAVTHPGKPGTLTAAAKTDGAAAEARHRDKITNSTYAHMAAADNAALRSFVAERHGRLHPSALGMLDFLAQKKAALWEGSADLVTYYRYDFMRRISIAVQKGTAIILRLGLQKARLHSSRRRFRGTAW